MPIKPAAEPEGIQLKEFGIAMGQIAEEKGISEEKVMETVEAALAAAYKRDYGKRGQHMRCEFDQTTGTAKFFLIKEVVDETVRDFYVPEEETEGEGAKPETASERVEEPADVSDEEKLPRYNPERDMTLAEAHEVKADAVVGETIEIELEPHDTFGRVAAQTAKQVIIQKIREAERESMFREFKEREGEVVSGTIQRIEGRTIFIDLGKSTGVLLPSEQVRSERYRLGQRIKVYVARVESDPKGPGIVLSRVSPDLVRKLFELEVPEIFAGSVEIKAIAREAGSRTKLAVMSKEESIDPIGSCVGQKGTRVQAVIDEISGEKIDIVEWNENIEKFIAAALSPAKVLAVKTDPATRSAQVTVPADQLSLAIGRQGQNVRLAAKLAEYRIDVAGQGAVAEPSEAPAAESKESLDETVVEASRDETNAVVERAPVAEEAVSAEPVEETKVSDEAPAKKKRKKKAQSEEVEDGVSKE